MLQVTIPAIEQWDEITGEFVYTKEYTLQMEHSLVSLSKWESKWCKPFLSKEEKTDTETTDYFKCMTITQNVDPKAYEYMPNSVRNQIIQYINAPMTATWFSDDKKSKGKTNGEQITSELIYYWMVALNIPMKCEKWHLNRLFTFIQVCNIKNQPAKKMSKRELMSRNAALNEARRKRLNSKG
jgi:hypothetical protein